MLLGVLMFDGKTTAKKPKRCEGLNEETESDRDVTSR